MVRHNLAAAYCAALVLRYNGGGVIAQGNGDDDDNSNADDGSSVSLNPAGSPTSSDVAADHPDCPGYISHIKDGYCDTDLNNAECGFDGGELLTFACGVLCLAAHQAHANPIPFMTGGGGLSLSISLIYW